MRKRKLAICSEDTEYTKRLVKCWMHHYSDRYEIFRYESLDDIPQEEMNGFFAILTDDEKLDAWVGLEEMKEHVVFLLSDESVKTPEHQGVIVEAKYQEVYKLKARIEQLHIGGGKTIGDKPYQMIGVYTLGNENKQLSFCALIAEEYAVKGKTLVINLQQNSRFETEVAYRGSFGLEEVLTAAKTGCDRKTRVYEAISSEEAWDYVYSVKNTECLAELTQDLCKKMVELLAESFEYEYIILNFGAVFRGIYDVMKSCDAFYFLTTRKETKNERELFFLEELELRGLEDFGQRINFVEMANAFEQSGGWRKTMAQWRWSDIGDFVRWSMKEGDKNGSIM